MPKSVGSTSKSLRSLNSVGTANQRVASRAASNQQRWKQPLLNIEHAKLQKGSNIAVIYCIVMSLFTIAHSVFDIYSLAVASPGVVHTGYYFISFDFVYAGNVHVRGSLLGVAVINLILGLALFFVSFVLMSALRKEIAARFRPWLYVMAAFTFWRLIAFIYWCVVNDMLYGYHISLAVLWFFFTVFNVIFLVVVFSLYRELANLTKLEDMVKLKGTLSSLSTHPSQHSMHSIHSISQPSPRGSNSTTSA